MPHPTDTAAWKISSQLQREIMDGRNKNRKVFASSPSLGDLAIDKIYVEDDLINMISGSDRYLVSHDALHGIAFRVVGGADDVREPMGFTPAP